MQRWMYEDQFKLILFFSIFRRRILDCQSDNSQVPLEYGCHRFDNCMKIDARRNWCPSQPIMLLECQITPCPPGYECKILLHSLLEDINARISCICHRSLVLGGNDSTCWAVSRFNGYISYQLQIWLSENIRWRPPFVYYCTHDPSDLSKFDVGPSVPWLTCQNSTS